MPTGIEAHEVQRISMVICQALSTAVSCNSIADADADPNLADLNARLPDGSASMVFPKDVYCHLSQWRQHGPIRMKASAKIARTQRKFCR